MEFLASLIGSITIAISGFFGLSQVSPVSVAEPIVDKFANVHSLEDLERMRASTSAIVSNDTPKQKTNEISSGSAGTVPTKTEAPKPIPAQNTKTNASTHLQDVETSYTRLTKGVIQKINNEVSLRLEGNEYASQGHDSPSWGANITVLQLGKETTFHHLSEGKFLGIPKTNGDTLSVKIANVWDGATDVILVQIPFEHIVTFDETLEIEAPGSVTVGKGSIVKVKNTNLSLKVLGIYGSPEGATASLQITSSSGKKINASVGPLMTAKPISVDGFYILGDAAGTGGVQAEIFIQPIPTLDLKVNGSDGPITISRGSSAQLSWSSYQTYGENDPEGGCYIETLSDTIKPPLEHRQYEGITNSMVSTSTGALYEETKYTLTCHALGGVTHELSDSVTILVPKATSLPQCKMSISPSNKVTPNEDIILSWTSENAARAEMGSLQSLQGSMPASSSGLREFSKSAYPFMTVYNEFGSSGCRPTFE